MKPKNSLFSRGGQAAAFITAVTLCVTGQSFAAEYDWNAATADFNNAANWTIGGSPAVAVPGSGDIANVANGGTAQWTTASAKTIQALRAGNAAAGTVSISSGNTFTTTGNVFAGRQSGSAVGTLTVSGANTVFTNSGGTTLVGSASTAVGTLNAGATGVLNITSGAVYNHQSAVIDSFRIGDNLPPSGGSAQTGTYRGTLNVDGGTLNLPSGAQLAVGQTAGAVGEVNVLNGGSITVSNSFFALGNGGEGTLNLSGGTVTKAGANAFAVGDYGGSAVVNHTGGTLAVTGGEIWVGQAADTEGTYNLNGGTINTSVGVSIGRAGGTGTFNFDSGTINKTGGGNFIVGGRASAASVGTMKQTGGTLNVNAGELWIGQNGNASPGMTSGTYELSGGTVNVNSWIAVGRQDANGVLNVTGGTLNKTGDAGFHVVVGEGNAANTGEINISGGLVNIQTGQLWVSENSAGTVTLSDEGELRVGAIQIAQKSSAYSGLLQLDGGTLRTGRIFGGPGTANVNFNGTTIVATANQALFIDNLDSATIQGGGAIIDTAGFNLAVGSTDLPQILGGTGNLTKEGLGTLTLNSVNTYEGTTAVNGGKLIVATDSAADNTVTVAAEAGFGVNLRAYDQSFKPAGLSLAGSTLDVNYGEIGDTSEPPIDVNGTLTLNGANNFINIGAILPGLWEQPSQVPVLRYDTVAGSGGIASVKLGTLPLGMQATLTHDTASKTFLLNVTRLAIPEWLGAVNNIWNMTDDNWANRAGNFGSKYANGDPVLFSDNADQGQYDVQLPGTVIPGPSVTFNNTINNYTLSGAGKISGTTRLIKQGTGSVTLNTAANDFTGGVRIDGGSVIIGSLSNGGAASPIGAAPAAASNLVLAGGTLAYSGATATSNRGFTIAGVGSGIAVTNAANNLTLGGPIETTAGGFVKRGPGSLTLTGSGTLGLNVEGSAVRVEEGKLVLNGTGTNPAQAVTAGQLWVGNTQAASASMDIINSTLTTSSWLAIGRGNGALEGTGPHTSSLNIGGGSIVSVVNISTGFANGLGNNVATQNITIADSTLNNSGQTALAEGRGATTNITATGDSVLNTREVRAGMGGGAVAGASLVNITLQDDAVWNVGTEAAISFASIGFDGGTGNLTVKGNAQFLNYDDFSLGEAGSSTGTLTIQDNAIVAVRTPLLGRGGDANALITQTGGSFSNRGDANFQIGVNGDAIYNLSGGTVTANGFTAVARFAGSTSSLNISGGTYTQTAADRLMIIGEEGNGTLSVSNNGTLQVNGGLRTALQGTGVATITQTGGVINVVQNAILGTAGTSTATLSGGQFNVKTGGTGGWNLVVGDAGASQGTLTISDTANLRLLNNSSLRIGSTSSTKNNTVTQTGGTVTTYSDGGNTVGGTGGLMIGGANATGDNIYNLSGGTLAVNSVGSEFALPANDRSRKLVFNGGTLKATGNNATFIQGLTGVEVLSGGAIVDTNSFNVTAINGFVQGGGGLTKIGTGTLTLAGVNTYDKDTAINAGGIVLADDAQLRFVLGANGVNNRITGTGTANLDGDFNIVTSSAAIANGNSWTLVAGPVNETYGATFNVIGYTKSGNVWTRIDGGNTWTFSQATGVLTLTTGGVTDPYTTWTNTYFPGVTDQNIIGRNADPDGDGSSNALEFALGGVPNNGADNAKVYSLQADGSVDSDTDKELLLTIAVRAATPAFSVGTSPSASKDGVTYTIQGSLDLTGFATGVTEVNVVAPASAPNPPAGYEYRTFSLNGSNNLTGKGFLRVRVN